MYQTEITIKYNGSKVILSLQSFMCDQENWRISTTKNINYKEVFQKNINLFESKFTFNLFSHLFNNITKLLFLMIIHFHIKSTK